MTWYFVDLDPRKGVSPILLEALDTLHESLREHFYVYDLAGLTRQVSPRL